MVVTLYCDISIVLDASFMPFCPFKYSQVSYYKKLFNINHMHAVGR